MKDKHDHSGILTQNLQTDAIPLSILSGTIKILLPCRFRRGHLSKLWGASKAGWFRSSFCNHVVSESIPPRGTLGRVFFRYSSASTNGNRGSWLRMRARMCMLARTCVYKLAFARVFVSMFTPHNAWQPVLVSLHPFIRMVRRKIR